jgi:hypothetical protein
MVEFPDVRQVCDIFALAACELITALLPTLTSRDV